MPQLDQFTYLTQFVWLCVFYMTFYVLLFNDGLPKISRILKLRAHLCADRPRDTDQDPESRKANAPKSLLHAGASTASGLSKMGGATSEQTRSLSQSTGIENQDVVFRTLSSSISYLNSSVTGAFNWCTKSVDSLNANQLKPMNKSYLRSIGEISLSQLIKSSALEASAPVWLQSRSSRSSIFLEVSRVWALRVQKCLLSSINKKKKKK